MPVIASNRISTPEVAEATFAVEQAGKISMARPFLGDPHSVAKAARGHAGRIAPCIACNHACLNHIFSGRAVELMRLDLSDSVTV